MTEGTPNAAWKLEALCTDLENVADECACQGDSDWTQDGVLIERAITLLRAYDALAEYARHSDMACPATFAPGYSRRGPCDCGLEDAQRAVADILDGKVKP